MKSPGQQETPFSPSNPTCAPGPRVQFFPEKGSYFSLFLTDHKDSVLSSEIFGKFYLNVLCSLLTNIKKRKIFGCSKQESHFREEHVCSELGSVCFARLLFPAWATLGWTASPRS